MQLSKNIMLSGIRKISFVRMSVKEQSFFVKRLSFLIKAGVPLLDSLVMIKEQTRKKGYASMLETVISDVSSGQYLSTSLAKFRNIFGDFSINIIGFGESSGILSENLEYLSDELRKKDALKKKVIGAFIYPFVVTLATFGMTGFLMIYLFPKIIPVFSSINMDLPLSTKIVIYVSNFLTNYGLIFIGSVITLIVISIMIVNKNRTIRFYFHMYTIKIPVISNVIKSYNLANSTRALGLLLKSGVPLSEALPITSKVLGNLVYKREFERLAENINRGEGMSLYLLKTKNLFPDVLTQIVSVGERSGNLSNSLMYLSEHFESEVDDFTKNISSLIEPVLMIFMGILVGFIAISIITPVYGITNHLQAR
ncbi:MAG: type IV pilus assembly protein PilC [Parcubacteria group bacterium Gr01-1014_46]|nr:MAG: type IV pilus assembly protein PilC [Parcubacteria group bacterium Gr01-1014_46]